MSDNKNSTKNQDPDEIDISKLFSTIFTGIKIFFTGILKLFLLFFDTVTANLKTFFILSILGGIIGLAFYYGTKPYFETNMTLGSVYYRGQLIKNSIESLNSLCEEGNFKTLAKVLKIPQQQAKSLKKVEIQAIISPGLQMLMEIYKENERTNRHLDSLLLKNQDTTFQVMLQVYDTVAINGLDSSLVNYLKENKYVKKRIEIERTNLRNRRLKLIKESSSLDTLKRNIALSYRNQAGGRSGTNNVILDDKGTNPIDVYREDLRLFEQILKIERLLYINSEIEIINPFISFGEPQGGTLEKNVLKGILAGILTSLVVVLIKILKIGMINLRHALREPEAVTS